MMEKEVNVIKVLKKSPAGLSITDLVGQTKFSRSTIRTVLAKLEGGGKVNIREVGMAKLYTLAGYKDLKGGFLAGK